MNYFFIIILLPFFHRFIALTAYDDPPVTKDKSQFSDAFSLGRGVENMPLMAVNYFLLKWFYILFSSLEEAFMANNGIEKKKGPNRYPLANHEQAKRTIARLTRDVIHGRIEPEKCRAAIYCINALIQIFRIEAPLQLNATIAGALQCEAITDLSCEDRKAELERLEAELRELMPGWNGVSASPPKRAAGLDAGELPEPAGAKAMAEDAGAAWQQSGIGAKRRRR